MVVTKSSYLLQLLFFYLTIINYNKLDCLHLTFIFSRILLLNKKKENVSNDHIVKYNAGCWLLVSGCW